MTLQEIVKITVPMCPPIMLLLELESVNIIANKVILAHMLTVSSALIATAWKAQEAPAIDDWVARVIRYMCFISKISAICWYSSGQGNALKDF